MRIYLAGQFTRRSELVGYATQLQNKGYEVTSRWLFEDTSTPTTVQLRDCADDYKVRCAVRDIEDISMSDMLVFFSEEEMTPRGSRHVEFGYALGLGKKVVVVGVKENIFHELIEQFNTWKEFVESV
jgi:hypothetical protein